MESESNLPAELEAGAEMQRASKAVAITNDARKAAYRELVGYRNKLLKLGGWPVQSSKGPKPDSQGNVLMAIEVLGLDCSFDIFRNMYIVEGFALGGGLVGDLNDKMVRAVREVCQKKLQFEPTAAAVREGLKRACEKRAFNSVQRYLSGLQWDGVPRVDKWLTRYMSVKDTALHCEWGRLVLFAACRRAFEPGAKFDHVLSLEGPEGGGKSTAVKIMAGATDLSAPCPYFSDSTILDKEEKQQLELCQGVWFYELSEMSGASKADQKKLKAFVTRQEDRAREAYAYFKTAQPRSPIFIASINPDPNTGEVAEYLNAGDRRRWWPVEVGVIDLDGLMADRDQLFAEAMARARIADDFGQVQWEPLTLPSKFWKLAEAEQIERQIKHPYRDLLAPLFDDVVRWSTTSAVADDELWTQPSKRDGYRVTDTRVMVAAWFILKDYLPQGASTEAGGRAVAASMGELGWQKVRVGKDGSRWYVRPRE
jgi:hypothetical protein